MTSATRNALCEELNAPFTYALSFGHRMNPELGTELGLQ